jgi:exoribonuclease R
MIGSELDLAKGAYAWILSRPSDEEVAMAIEQLEHVGLMMANQDESLPKQIQTLIAWVESGQLSGYSGWLEAKLRESISQGKDQNENQG